MPSPPAPLTVGERVRIRGTIWTVARRAYHGRCESIVVVRGSRDAPNIARTFLLPFDRVVRVDAVSAVRLLPRRRFLHGCARLWLTVCPFGGFRTAARAQIALMPFQMEPALAMLRHGRLRLLIADEVGLGKTVQAALIASELHAAGDGVRTLIICPAGLRDQWCDELRTRFALEPTTPDAEWLARTGRDLPAWLNPWSLPGTYVCSIDFLKQVEVRRGLEDVRWDLLVVDEAHTAAPGTARLSAVRTIAARATRIVMLTATPPDSDPPAVEALQSAGRLDPGERLTVFRRTRADVGLPAARKTVLLGVRLTPLERRLQRLLHAYAALVWREAESRRDPAARLTAVVLRKRALSSARSILVSVRRRIALLATRPLPGEQLNLPLHAEDELEDTLLDGVLAAPGLSDVPRERALLEEIAAHAERAAAIDSKTRFLQRLVRRLREPVIVFTEYRDTLTALAGSLAFASPRMLHGGLAPAERAEVQRAFSASGRLLLATDAAAEGLNLHRRCRAVVHFELPWTGTRLEQRAGRVDRLGQTRTVHEIALVARDTCERLVLAPLVRRIRAGTAGSRRTHLLRLSESAIAAAVLGGVKLSAPRTVADASAHSAPDLKGESGQESRRAASHRRLLAVDPSLGESPTTDLYVTAAQPDRGRALALVRVSIERADGRSLHDELVPLAFSPARMRRVADTRRIRNAALGLLHGGDGELTAAALSASRVRSAQENARVVLTAIHDRETAIQGRLRAELLPFQRELFGGPAATGRWIQHQADTSRNDDTNVFDAAAMADARVRTRVVALCFGPLFPGQ